MLQYKKILVPIDFSDICRASIRKAVSLRSTYKGNLVLLHVVDYLPPPYASADMPAIFASEDLMQERAHKHLSDLSQELGVGECEHVVITGKTNKKLVEYIGENDIDLVVMAAHNNSTIERLLGSTTQKVIQGSTCDVLVIHG